MKSENKNKLPCKFCGLDEFTQERIKDISRFLEYSETDVIKILVDQYYKMQVIEHEDEDGYLSLEFIPFYETAKSYQELKDEYKKEYDAEYPAVIINAENYKDFVPNSAL
ncbi:MAG: hypothetical protein FWD71_19410 [Oscillospiraceae bacterium]|nr:hypothetical protein [Oscillospiraceae bacterium]